MRAAGVNRTPTAVLALFSSREPLSTRAGHPTKPRERAAPDEVLGWMGRLHVTCARRDSATVRRRCQRHLRGFPIPRPFSLEALAAQIAQERGRPLHLRMLPQPTDPALPTGLWLRARSADYVLYDGRTSDLHRRLIVLHECSHIMLGHDDATLPDNDVLFRAPQDPLRADVIRQIHERRSYTSTQELEAETMATLLLEAIGQLPVPSPLAGFTVRMAAALGYNSYR